MARVLLVNPPSWSDAYRMVFGCVLPPLGLCSIAASLRMSNHEVRIVDLNSLADYYNKSNLLNYLKNVIESFKPEYIGVSIIATSTAPTAYRIAKEVKDIDESIVTIAGGHHATFMPIEVLMNGFDYVVKGEGELTLTELINILEFNRDPSSVKGIAYRRGSKYIETPRRGFLENLDELPLPARDLLDRKRYILRAIGLDATITTAETSRGCPYNCDFCSASPMWGRRWRYKSIERIIHELDHIKKEKWRHIFFVDDNFITPVNIEERRRLFQEIIKERLDVEWICQLRTDIIVKNPDLINLASKAGMKVAFIGVESGDENVLRKMGKGIIPSISEKAVEILKNAGIITLAGFVIGAPYETLKQAYRTLRFALKLCKRGLDAAQFSIFTPLPGSRSFIEAIEKRLLATRNWILYDCLHPVITKNKISTYIFMRLAHYIFYIFKWIYGRTYSRGTAESVISTASRYLLRNLPRHIISFLKLPVDITKILHHEFS